MIRVILVLCCLGFLSACQTAPLPELHYHGALSADAGDLTAASDRLVDTFASRSGFRLEKRTPSTASGDKARIDYSLRNPATPHVVVQVSASLKDRIIAVTVTGDPAAPAATAASQTFEAVFTELFPDANYLSFQKDSAHPKP